MNGKLLGISKEQIDRFRQGDDVRVGINEGNATYKFGKLEDDGSYELVRLKP